MKKKLLSAFTAALFCMQLFSQETFVKQTLKSDFGQPVFNPILNPFGIQWSQTIRGASGGLITVAHTNVSGQGENILVTSRDADGNIIFQTDYDVAGLNNNDYGVGVYEAPSGEIYVCGTTDNGGATNYDGVILRYSASGTLLKWATYPGGAGLNDIATASIIHPITGSLIVALTNENSGTGYDYMVLEMDPINLGLLNTNTYDGAHLVDVAMGVEIEPASGDIMIVGGSQGSLFKSGYAIAIFNQSLSYLSATRTDVVGNPTDQPLAFKRYGSSTYITGKSFIGSSYDVKTVKINPNYSIAWTITQNFYGLDDIGNTIDVDPLTGDVIIGGLCTKGNGISDLFAIRYNGSTGGIVGSPFQQAAENPSGNAFIKKLSVSATGNVYFIGGEKGNSGNMQVIVGKILPNGFIGWQKKFSNPAFDLQPSDIDLTTEGVFAISVKDSAAKKYAITGYKELTLDTTKKYVGSTACWKTGEILVAFNPSIINKSTVDNDNQFGDLSEFLSVAAYAEINTAVSKFCRECSIQAVKVYDRKTTDTIAVTRQGVNIPIPSVYATLLLKLPSNLSETQAQSILNTLPHIVVATQLNNFIQVCNVPNDSLYYNQANLHPTNSYLNADINVEEAWNIVTGCGSNSIKGGVFDTGVMWRHKEFGFTGTPTSGNNKMRGWYFGSGFGPNSAANGGVDMRTQTFGLSDIMLDPWGNGGHGTQVSGIIGAQRNNTSGVAGIAGGDGSLSNAGVKLYSLNVAAYTMYWWLSAAHQAHTGATPNNANPSPYAYGVDFSNHSYKMVPGWWPLDSFPLVNREIHWANRLGVTLIASRGNDSLNNVVVPATNDSCWAISVGGSNTSGTKWGGSSYGSGMDIIAPSVSQLVTSTATDRSYVGFAGTSCAAPHASGVVALLMSYMNDSTNQYMNLAPEDCDFIIQRSATDVGPAGYDLSTGFGRLNAGKALRMVERPTRIFYHFGTNALIPHTLTKGLYSYGDTVKLTEFYENYASPRVTYPVGRYIVNTYQVNATVSHPGLSPIDSIAYYWPRHSASHVYSLPDAQKRLNMHERVIINSLSTGGAILTGYVYEVKDSTGTNVGWWPCDTSFTSANMGSLFEYSLIAKNKRPVGIEEKLKDGVGIEVYPNPANLNQTLTVDTEKESDCVIELYDLMGRYLKTVFNGKTTAGKTTITHDVGSLPNSMYIYVIRIDGNTTSKKFIKE